MITFTGSTDLFYGTVQHQYYYSHFYYNDMDPGGHHELVRKFQSLPPPFPRTEYTPQLRLPSLQISVVHTIQTPRRPCLGHERIQNIRHIPKCSAFFFFFFFFFRLSSRPGGSRLKMTTAGQENPTGLQLRGEKRRAAAARLTMSPVRSIPAAGSLPLSVLSCSTAAVRHDPVLPI